MNDIAVNKPATAADLASDQRPFTSTYKQLIWLPLVVTVAGALAYWQFVSFAFKSNPGLNGMILATMLWGSWTMVTNVMRVYREEAVFRSGLSYLRMGAWSDEPDPALGPKAHVLGMLSRLQKLGLGHQVYVQSAAMEPELTSLEQYFDKKQELSQYLVGLMVGLGLLGTFVGLLETLLATSSLIATIANSGSGTSGSIESEFARVVGGLEQPLAAMGTAFSASMFGLVGSIMLGFQMVVVRKCSGSFVDHARDDVLSLAEKSKVSSNVQITERFLATLLADFLEQQKITGQQLKDVTTSLQDLLPQVSRATTEALHEIGGEIKEQHRLTVGELSALTREIGKLAPSVADAAVETLNLGRRVASHEEALERTATGVSAIRDLIPLLRELSQASDGVFRESRAASTRVGKILELMPQQARIAEQLEETRDLVINLRRDMGEIKGTTAEMSADISMQKEVTRSLDAAVWSLGKTSLRSAFSDHGTDPKRGE
jgi:hypothetical protein